jgi:predicted ATPase
MTHGELCKQDWPLGRVFASRMIQALVVARRREAKSWELRAAMSMSRLWQQQGKCAKARALLAPIYDWFTEGFDTADLQEAKALLEAVSEATPGKSVRKRRAEGYREKR